MYLYSQCLQRADFVMVNSSWTKNHIDTILKHSDGVFETIDTAIQALMTPFSACAAFWLPNLSLHTHKATTEALRVYPPCDTRSMTSFVLEGRDKIILSIAQFRFVCSKTYRDQIFTSNYRPEKDHPMQIRALQVLLREHPEYKSGPGCVRMVLLGGVRNEGDTARVDNLRNLAHELGVIVREIAPMISPCSASTVTGLCRLRHQRLVSGHA
jgi:alpha-1,2-mannosyltransferase